MVMFMKTINFLMLIFLFPLINESYARESLFPELQGWKLTEENEIYDSNNLWDIIDGAADLFLEYSFLDLHVVHYLSEDSIEVKVELYRHNNSLNAFGIYSQERNPEYHFIRAGAQGYIEDNVLNFLDGVFYVKLSTYENGERGREALLFIAEKLDEFLKQENSFPHILSCLPDESKQINTEKYTARNFLGYSFFNSAVTALYKENSINFTLFIVDAKTPAAADSVLKQYIELQNIENVRGFGNNGYLLNDKNIGKITIAVVNNFIYGLINCTDQDSMAELMHEAELKLKAFK